MSLMTPRAIDPATVLSRLPHAPGAQWLVVTGQWTAEIGEALAERIGVLDLGGETPILLLDCWVRREALPELRSLLAHAAWGEWDVMFATRWKYAWGGTPFGLWSRRGLVARVAGAGRLAVRPRLFGAPVEERVVEVRSELSSAWTMRRLLVRTEEGRVLSLASRREWGAVLDPTYDGLDLLVDASWLQSLGARLAEALQVPLVTNDSVLESPSPQA